MKLNLKISFLLLSLLTGSCAPKVMNFSVVSSKNINLKSISEYQVSSKMIKGESMESLVLFIPTGLPTADEAIQDALRKSGSIALVNGTITQPYWWFFLYGKFGYEVEGYPLIKPTKSRY